jgi:hypothetical protein
VGTLKASIGAIVVLEIFENGLGESAMEYPKINSLWKREGWYFDEAAKKDKTQGPNRQSFIVGDYACPEFANISLWNVEEKVDGTNIRVYWHRLVENGELVIRFHGRTKDAQVPTHLLSYLQETFTPEVMEKLCSHYDEDSLFQNKPVTSGCLYGEGYGPKIQAAGGNYRKDAGFILFDVKIGNWWLKREDVKMISEKLGIPMVPQLGMMRENEIVKFVQSKPLSRCSLNPQMMEGVVCRPEPLMLFRNGNPIVWKLKSKEFV